MAKGKYQKKLKCSNANIGLNTSTITFIEEEQKKPEGLPAIPIKSGVTISLYLTNAKEAQTYTPGETYTITIE